MVAMTGSVRRAAIGVAALLGPTVFPVGRAFDAWQVLPLGHALAFVGGFLMSAVAGVCLALCFAGMGALSERLFGFRYERHEAFGLLVGSAFLLTAGCAAAIDGALIAQVRPGALLLLGLSLGCYVASKVASALISRASGVELGGS